jgi:hypothetical protein
LSILGQIVLDTNLLGNIARVDNHDECRAWACLVEPRIIVDCKTFGVGANPALVFKLICDCFVVGGVVRVLSELLVQVLAFG